MPTILPRGFSSTKPRQDRHAAERAQLEETTKPLYDLVLEERFLVDNVTSQNYPTSFTPSSETRIGSKSTGYPTGYRIQTLVEVTSDRHVVPVKKLMFAGTTVIRVGDTVIARIPCYEKIRPFWLGESEESYYIPRPMQELEHAIELRILLHEKTIRTDRSALYSDFAKQQT